MGAGAFIEPAVVLSLLLGGTWVNRSAPQYFARKAPHHSGKRRDSVESLESGGSSSPAVETDGLLSPGFRSSSPGERAAHDGWRKREIHFWGWRKSVWSADTKQFEDRMLSRLLRRFPFLVEVWYWALIYWVYQLGRAFTAVTIVQGTVHSARRHAVQLIHLEQRLHIFWELSIQQFFLQYPLLMHWINRIYSFIHIPGTILFLIGLYYYTITSNRLTFASPHTPPASTVHGSPAGPALYQARRRTMAVCNLIAFIVFTAWPCMPPRLLSDPAYKGKLAPEARGYGFVDTVHGAEGESSVWTQNKFCNQYAAMPSLHFGYSLLIGLTVATIPLAPHHERTRRVMVRGRVCLRLPSARRVACVLLGLLYPAIILVAIIATANHFILDAVAGAIVCGIAWQGNGILLNLCPLEDWFLWCLRMHKPEIEALSVLEGEEGERVWGQGVVTK
ncbi:hypothetical protein M8818_000393 [Zalaria obscura]|uniref:Uncharacterized protein n=1 Tax=Zalaria obscura TaxID=2024903 RepID=A0ACC3SPN7_9PEZI